MRHDDSSNYSHLVLNCGEGNGIPLQYSCLENPMVGGAWWAAVHGVAKSRTRLKRLNSSSSTLLNSNCNSLDLPGGPVIKNLPVNAGHAGSIPPSGKIPHVSGQLSACATTTEPAHPGAYAPQ